MMPFQLNNQRGITLIEMMVAITVGLILLAGIVELFVTNKQAYRIQEGTNVLNENARYLLNQFDYDLRMVGHWGGVLRGGGASGTTFSGVKVVGTAPAPDCTQSPALSLQGAPTRGAFGLQGFDGGNLSPLSCIPAADYKPFTDVLVVRYGGAERVTNAAVLALPSTKFLRTGSDQIAEIFNGSTFNTLYNSGAANGLQAEAAGFLKERNATYLYNVYYYFVRKCASQDKGTAGVCDAADDTTPTLTRLSLRGGALVQEDVMAGVEQFQVTYGVDTDPTDGNPAPDRFDTATAVTAANNWDNIAEVRVSFVLRNPERDPTYHDPVFLGTAPPYRLYGGAAGAGVGYTPVAADQQFHRKVINSSIQMRNLNLARVR